MNIGIVELHYHSEYLDTMIRIFDKESIDVFTTQKIYGRLSEGVRHRHCFIFPDGEKTHTFLSGIDTSDYDLFFVNTIQPSMMDIPKYIDFRPECKSFLTLHNLTAWDTKSIPLNFNMIHMFDSFISSVFTKKIMCNYDGISVVNETLLPFVKTFSINKKMVVIPNALAIPSIGFGIDKRTVFVVPGAVDLKRRDYENVITSYLKLKMERDDIHLVLLGRFNNSLYVDRDEITVFDCFVNREKYDKVLRESDFIVCPQFRKTCTINTNRERYGITKSPNIFESYRMRKPLVVPSYLSIPSVLSSSTIFYENDMYNAFKKAVEEKKFYRDEAVKNSSYYLLENVRNRVYAGVCC